MLLKTILNLGNLTNVTYGRSLHATRKGMASGFRMKALIQLKDIKASDGKNTLLNYLVDIVAKNTPEVNQNSNISIFRKIFFNITDL